MNELSEYGDTTPNPRRRLRAGAIITAGALCLGGLFAGAVTGGGETVAPGWHGSVDCFGNIVSAVPGVGEQGTVRIAYEPPLLVWYGAGDVILDTAYPTKPENCAPPTTPAPTTTTVAPTTMVAPTTTTQETVPPSTTSTEPPPTVTTPSPSPDSSVSSTTTTPPETSAAPTTTSPGVTLPLPTPPSPPTPPRPQTTQPEPYCTRFPNAEGCVEGLPTAETG